MAKPVNLNHILNMKKHISNLLKLNKKYNNYHG